MEVRKGRGEGEEQGEGNYIVWVLIKGLIIIINLTTIHYYMASVNLFARTPWATKKEQ